MKNYRFLVMIGMVALLGGSVYKTYDSRKTLNDNYEGALADARENRKLGVWVNAEEDYLNAIEINDNIDVRVELGQMYLDAGNKGTAINWGEELTNLYPKEVSGYEFLIKAYITDEDYASCFEVKDKVDALKLSSKEIKKEISDIQYEYYLEHRYDDASVFSSGYCRVKYGDTYGYVDTSGVETTNTDFVEAGTFSDELAPVVDKDGEAYYIDTDGHKKKVIDFVDNVKKLGFIYDDIFPLYDGTKWTFYNLDGKKIAGGYDDVSSIGNGVAAVKENDKWHLINEKGKNVSDDEYDEVAIDEKGVVLRNDRIFAKAAGKYYLLDEKGKKVTDDTFEDARPFNGEGYAAVRIDGKWGFIDKDGKVVIKPEYVEARSFSNGFAAVRRATGWGFINEDNDVVIECKFDGAKDFNEQGCVFVEIDDDWNYLLLYSKNH